MSFSEDFGRVLTPISFRSGRTFVGCAEFDFKYASHFLKSFAATYTNSIFDMCPFVKILSTPYVPVALHAYGASSSSYLILFPL